MKAVNVVIPLRTLIQNKIHETNGVISREHGEPYHFSTYSQWITPCAPILWCFFNTPYNV